MAGRHALHCRGRGLRQALLCGRQRRPRARSLTFRAPPPARRSARHSACADVRHGASRWGSNRSPVGMRSAIAGVPGHRPAPTAASAAAPVAVASTAPRSTGVPAASACSCSSSGSRVRPPSTRSTSTGVLLPDHLDDVGHPPGDRLERRARHVRRTARLPSAPPPRRAQPVATTGLRARRAPAARAPRRHPRPRSARPAKAGASGASPRSRDSQSSRAPAVNTPPSSAHSTSPPTRQATVGSSPPDPGRPLRCRRWRARTRRCRTWPWCDPARRSPLLRAQPAGPGTGRAVAARRARTGGAACPGRRRCRRSRAAPRAVRRRSPAGRRPTPAPRAAFATLSPGPCRSPRRGGRDRNESTVPIRSVPASRARATPASCSSSHASFPAEKYGSSGRPLSFRIRSAVPACSSRSSTSCERLSCHVTTGVRARPVSTSHASTDSPWWSRPQATTSPGASSSTSADGLDHGGDHVLGILLHPTRPGMVQRLLAPRLAQRPQIGVEQDRLHGRGALVDAEQQAHRERYSAALRHHGTRDCGVVPGSSGRSGRSTTPSRCTRAQTYSAMPERCRQAGGADRCHVDEPGARTARARSGS